MLAVSVGVIIEQEQTLNPGGSKLPTKLKLHRRHTTRRGHSFGKDSNKN